MGADHRRVTRDSGQKCARRQFGATAADIRTAVAGELMEIFRVIGERGLQAHAALSKSAPRPRRSLAHWFLEPRNYPSLGSSCHVPGFLLGINCVLCPGARFISLMLPNLLLTLIFPRFTIHLT